MEHIIGQYKKLKTWATQTPQKKTGVNASARELLVGLASFCKKPVVLLIYTVKFGKSLGSDGGKKKRT